MEDSEPQFQSHIDEDDQINASQLSGDENTEKNVEKDNSSKANLLLTVTTIIKTVIGAGILSFPYTFSKLGYVFGFLMFFVIIALTQFTCFLLMKSKNLSRHSNYSTIISHISENKFIQILPSLAIFSANFGVCIIELMILKDALKQIIDELIQVDWARHVFYTSPAFIVVIIAILEIRFILVKKIQNYKIIAFVGVLGVSAFVITLVAMFFQYVNQKGHCNNDFKPFENDLTGIVSVLPNYIFSFTYQWNFFPIFKGMRNVTDQRMAKASILGLIGCAVLYTFAGLAGYCMFGRDVKSNFLLSISRKNVNQVLYFLLKFCFLVSVFIAYPIILFGARNNGRSLYKKIRQIISQNRRQRIPEPSQIASAEITNRLNTESEVQQIQTSRKAEKKEFYIFTFVLHILIVILAIVFQDIQDVFNVIGSLSGSAINFLFPSSFYFTLIKQKQKEKRKIYYFAWAAFIFFIPFAFFAIVSNYI